MAGPDTPAEADSAQAPPSRRRRGPVILIVLVALAALIAWLAYTALSARSALAQAAQQAVQLQDELTSGDSTAAKRTLAKLQDSTRIAADRTDGPIWALGTHLPFLGSNVEAVRTSTSSLVNITDRALPPLVSISGSLDSDLFKPRSGRFDLRSFETVRGPITQAADVLTEERARLESIDADALLPPLRPSVTDLTAKVVDAQRAADASATGLRLAPGLLGADGDRTYLVLFQNNAESRTSGGISGAMGLVRASKGRLSFDQDFSKDQLGFFDPPAAKLTREERLLFGTTPATDYRDINLIPDFPRAARIARAMVAERPGITVDGVLSIDPVALSYALRGTGPVDVGAGVTLTADNTVEVLLNGVYDRFPDPQQQDAFFEAAAGQIFSQILDGRGDPRKVIAGLTQAADEHRILLWSDREDEQRVIADTELSGAIGASTKQPQVGVFFNDAISSKMQYYLRWKTRVEATECRADGAQRLTITTRITSTAPRDGRGLADYVRGPSELAKSGKQAVGMQIALPVGSRVERFEVDGKRSIYSAGTFLDRPFAQTTPIVAPGGTQTVTVTVITGAGQRGAPVLDTTPGVFSAPNGQKFDSACG